MDMFLSFVTLFLVANMAIVFTMLRRIDLNNSSVQAWEQEQAVHLAPAPQTTFTAALTTELAQ
ncbi:hypothetical protein LMJ53_02785 [Rheinheimera sp. UJ51]|uniref:hypothetical protein n=1 Tax=unclassified Rheinheimera TaxID=115860 RepID=UPI001E5AE77E|nr:MULTISPECIES: hypothetical protein [unclassified Rheinheimera]MCC5450660.1 hypothetical protein [Rheinheimera sp. UJ51]MCF4008674.1 hypothetical protein [Rheinheimera sp. UJ63]